MYDVLDTKFVCVFMIHLRHKFGVRGGVVGRGTELQGQLSCNCIYVTSQSMNAP